MDQDDPDGRDLEHRTHDPDDHQVNFEEAIRMATDNKITSANSWQFALIDYFHNMNMLKGNDGSSINFQRAGATLDGCMKILSHRIDSVATDTGALLSGLAHRNEEIVVSDKSEDEDEDEAEYGDEPKPKRKKVKVQRSTLKQSFEDLKLKQYEKQLEIDPLFTRALSGFDEGGAKSLLLNLLKVNDESRVVFDETLARDDGSGRINSTSESTKVQVTDADNLAASKLIKDNQFDLESRLVCPSMSHVEEVLTNTDLAKTFAETLLDDGVEQVEQVEVEEYLPDDVDVGGINDDMNVVANDIQTIEDANGDAIVHDHPALPEEVAGSDIPILSQLDRITDHNSWAGKQSEASWRIGLVKRKRLEEQPEVKPKPTPKPQKHCMEIDFMQGGEDGLLFKKGRITRDRESRWKNKEQDTLLPNDLHWDTAKMVKSFIKPGLNISIFRKHFRHKSEEDFLPDEEFWATAYDKQAAAAVDDNVINENGPLFDDAIEQSMQFEDDIGDGDFDFSQQMSTQVSSQQKLHYDKTSKRVDVRMLKKNMWEATVGKDGNIDTHLSSVARDTFAKYGGKQRQDMSTPFFFICMLHLANEHDLTIEDNEDGTDLSIHGDSL